MTYVPITAEHMLMRATPTRALMKKGYERISSISVACGAGGAFFADDEEEFVADGFGEGDAAELEAPGPGGDIVGRHGEEHFAEFFGFRVGVFGLVAARGEAVEFFVVEVLDFLAYGAEERVALAGDVHPAASLSVGCFGGSVVRRGSCVGVFSSREPVVEIQQDANAEDGGEEYQGSFHRFILQKGGMPPGLGRRQAGR